jgi:hypothetical protein
MDDRVAAAAQVAVDAPVAEGEAVELRQLLRRHETPRAG